MLLKGIRVLDLSRMLPGPYCSMILADLGAEVIRVDDPTFPLTEPPPYIKKGNYYESSFNMILNRNKRSIAINLKKSEGLRIFYKMAENSDVILESYRPDAVKKLKVDFDIIKGINPSIIYCSISGYGQTGPYKDLPGHDLNYLALTGSLYLNRPRFDFKEPNKERPPIVPGVQFADLAASFNATIGILAALYEREKNPNHEGQYIDISISDCAFTLNPYHAAMEFANWEEDILQGDYPFYNIYKTKDNKYITLGAIEPKFWHNLCEALDLPSNLEKMQMAKDADREKVFEILEKKFIEKNAKDWFEILSKKDIPVMDIKNFEEACQDPHIIARKMLIEKNHSQFGKIKHIASPIKYSRTPLDIHQNAVKKGANTQEILREFGFSDEDYKYFKRKGVFR
ncbi:MAG: CaiB/BaiF CoA transferase family protein [Promethearchaeota archaeon]